MNAANLREKSVPELRTELESLLLEQFKLRMQHGAGELARTHQLRAVRRNVARLRTVINEKINNGDKQ